MINLIQEIPIIDLLFKMVITIGLFIVILFLLFIASGILKAFVDILIKGDNEDEN